MYQMDAGIGNLTGETFISLPPNSHFVTAKHLICSLVPSLQARDSFKTVLRPQGGLSSRSTFAVQSTAQLHVFSFHSYHCTRNVHFRTGKAAGC